MHTLRVLTLVHRTARQVSSHERPEGLNGTTIWIKNLRDLDF